MTAPRLAATRPAALTGRVGQGGENRIHDVALVQALLGMRRDKRIALDVEIKKARGNDYVLVAHFTPRNLWVHNGRTLSSVPNNTQVRARSKALYEAVTADLKARSIQAFGITDPADVKIQNDLKDDLACVVWTELEGVEALTQFLLAEGRKRGLKLAVRFFEHYLGASGSSIEVSRAEAFEFDACRAAANAK